MDKLQKIAKISPARCLHRDHHHQSTVVLSIALTADLDISAGRLLHVFTRLPAFLLEAGPRYRSVIVRFLCISLMSFLIFLWTSFSWTSFSESLYLSFLSFHFLFLFLSLHHFISFFLFLSFFLFTSLFLSLYLSLSLTLLSLLLPLVSSCSSCNLPIKSSLLVMKTDNLFYTSKKYLFLCKNSLTKSVPPSWHTCDRSLSWF